MVKEYYLEYWGQVENENWIERDLGIKERSFWFNSEEERAAFKANLKEVASQHDVIIAFREEEGELTHKRTIANVELKYKGMPYSFKFDFSYEYPDEAARYMFIDGNYSCDCNKSSFIQSYCDSNFPELGCGDEIEMVNLKISKE